MPEGHVVEVPVQSVTAGAGLTVMEGFVLAESPPVSVRLIVAEKGDPLELETVPVMLQVVPLTELQPLRPVGSPELVQLGVPPAVQLLAVAVIETDWPTVNGPVVFRPIAQLAEVVSENGVTEELIELRDGLRVGL